MRSGVSRLRRSLWRAAGLANQGALKLRRGKPLAFDPLVRLTGLKFFARRYYGQLIDLSGVTFSDVDETIGRIRSVKPEAWVRAWERTAAHYDRLGREAAADCR